MDKITIATFSNVQDKQPKAHTVSWPKLAERLTVHTERDDKDGPLFSPVTYKNGATRGNAGVSTINLAVADFDHGEDWQTIKAQLQVYEYVAYSTYSFTPEDCRFRVVIPLSQSVNAADWPDVKARIDYHVFRQGADPAAKDRARLYYLPSCPPGALRFAEHHEGKWLDVSTLSPAPGSQRIPKNGASEAGEHAGPTERPKVQLGKTALDFVANGAPLGEQRSRALAAARNYLSAGYGVGDTAAAIWRGFQSSPQDPDRGPWAYEDALFIAENLERGDAPELDLIAAPVPPRAEIRKFGLGYECTFPAEGVTIFIDHLYRRSDGLKGEINVQTTVPGVPRDLYSGNFILSTLAARASTAKHLASRCEGSALNKTLWEFILEDFCRKVVLAERQGEPIKRIGTQMLLNKSTWLVWEAILNKDIGTVFGPGQTGKSRLALAWALTVLTGVEFVPGFNTSETGEILYLDWETSEEKLIARCQHLCKGVGLEPVDFWYQPCRVPFVEMYEKTMKDVQANDVKLVILDSVEAATAGTREGGADQNAAVMLLYQALRHLNTSVLLIDHVNSAQANQTEGVRKPYGSIFKYNYARYAFELRNLQAKKQPGDEHLVLQCAKYNDGSMPKPVGLHVTWDGMKTRYESETAAPIVTGEKQVQLKKIQVALEQGPMTYTEIATATGLAENKVRAIVAAYAHLFTKDDSRKTVVIENNDFN